jgi:hypothetical protein
MAVKTDFNNSTQGKLIKIQLLLHAGNYSATSMAFLMRSHEYLIAQIAKYPEKDTMSATQAMTEGMKRHNAALDRYLKDLRKCTENFIEYMNGCAAVNSTDEILLNPIMEILRDEIDLDA